MTPPRRMGCVHSVGAAARSQRPVDHLVSMRQPLMPPGPERDCPRNLSGKPRPDCCPWRSVGMDPLPDPYPGFRPLEGARPNIMASSCGSMGGGGSSRHAAGTYSSELQKLLPPRHAGSFGIRLAEELMDTPLARIPHCASGGRRKFAYSCMRVWARHPRKLPANISTMTWARACSIGSANCRNITRRTEVV
jgi:hypothetical protein